MKKIIAVLILLGSVSAFAGSNCDLERKEYFFLKKARSYRIIERALNKKGYHLVDQSNLSLEDMKVEGYGTTRIVTLWLWDKSKDGGEKLIKALYGQHTSNIFTGVTEYTLRKATLRAIESLPSCEQFKDSL